MSRRELILYATPSGALAETCAGYFEAASAHGSTAAQGYPPHCTLTGFFHRTDQRVDGVAAEVRELLADAGEPPAGSVQLRGPRRHDHWLGLEIESSWLEQIVAGFVDRHQLESGDDLLRPKDWFHLSLAYDVLDLEPYVELAHDFDFTVGADEPWLVALWERGPGGNWRRFDEPA
jgi:ubiquitin-associated SH3 domain-containing protein